MGFFIRYVAVFIFSPNQFLGEVVSAPILEPQKNKWCASLHRSIVWEGGGKSLLSHAVSGLTSREGQGEIKSATR